MQRATRQKWIIKPGGVDGIKIIKAFPSAESKNKRAITSRKYSEMDKIRRATRSE